MIYKNQDRSWMCLTIMSVVYLMQQLEASQILLKFIQDEFIVAVNGFAIVQSTDKFSVVASGGIKQTECPVDTCPEVCENGSSCVDGVCECLDQCM